MLLPRPEIRIATRLGSRIVRRGPIRGRIPASCRPADGTPSRALLDPTDLEHGLAGTFERRADLCGGVAMHDHSHAHPAVERARHFFSSYPTAALQLAENLRQLPVRN